MASSVNAISSALSTVFAVASAVSVGAVKSANELPPTAKQFVVTVEA